MCMMSALWKVGSWVGRKPRRRRGIELRRGAAGMQLLLSIRFSKSPAVPLRLREECNRIAAWWGSGWVGLPSFSCGYARSRLLTSRRHGREHLGAHNKEIIDCAATSLHDRRDGGCNCERTDRCSAEGIQQSFNGSSAGHGVCHLPSQGLGVGHSRAASNRRARPFGFEAQLQLRLLQWRA
jgi:hypothetical protein